MALSKRPLDDNISLSVPLPGSSWMHAGMGTGVGAGRGQEERLGAMIGLLLESPGKGQSCLREPGSFTYRAEPKDRNSRMTGKRGKESMPRGSHRHPPGEPNQRWR